MWSRSPSRQAGPAQNFREPEANPNEVLFSHTNAQFETPPADAIGFSDAVDEDEPEYPETISDDDVPEGGSLNCGYPDGFPQDVAAAMGYNGYFSNDPAMAPPSNSDDDQYDFVDDLHGDDGEVYLEDDDPEVLPTVEQYAPDEVFSFESSSDQGDDEEHSASRPRLRKDNDDDDEPPHLVLPASTFSDDGSDRSSCRVTLGSTSSLHTRIARDFESFPHVAPSSWPATISMAHSSHWRPSPVGRTTFH